MPIVSARVAAAAIVLPLVAGLLTAVAFMLMPLGTVNSVDGQTGWCGAGNRSDGAVVLMFILQAGQRPPPK